MDIIKKVLTDVNFLGAVFSTISIILLGYYLRKSGKVKSDANKVLTTILLNVALPALAFNAFMGDINDATFKTGLNSFAFGFVMYILLIVITYVYMVKYKGNKLDAMRGLTIFGSTTFFGIPIITAFLGKDGVLYANLANIAYRVFLYSYGLMLFSTSKGDDEKGSKFDLGQIKTIILNPIVLATFIGFVIWIFQKSLPTVSFDMVKEGKVLYTNAYPILRIDQTLPWVFKALKYVGDLSSPLAWLAIGMTLAEISLGDAAKDKDSWVYSIVKLAVEIGRASCRERV